MSSFFGRPLTLLNVPAQKSDTHVAKSRCPDFIAFLAIFLEDETCQHFKFQPVLTNRSFEWADVSMGGISFDVRKVRYSTFPTGLDDDRFKGREFVAVKHPRVEIDDMPVEDVYSELATELQVLRHTPFQKHENIVDLLGMIYHDSGDIDTPNILPALVLEFAELGSVKDYQLNGYGTSYADKLDIIRDAARGIEALHSCGIIHGDVKPSNLLVFKHPNRKFVVKLTDFGFAMAENDDRLIGYTKCLEAPEAGTKIDPRYRRQLDIFSYGLLVHTVFRNGVLYHESIPEETRDAEMLRLKQEGLLAGVIHTHFLLNLEHDECPAFLFCKLLLLCLHTEPQMRFDSMSDILSILHYADTSATYSYPRVSTALPELFYHSTKIQFQNMQNLAMGSLLATIALDGMPKTETRQPWDLRARREMEYWCKSHSDWKDLQTFCISITTAIRTFCGLVPNMDSFSSVLSAFASISSIDATQAPFTLSKTEYLPLQFSTKTILDLHCFNGFFRRAPAMVKEKIALELEWQAYSTPPADTERKHWALLSLASLTIDDVDFRYDLQKGLDMLHQSANLGNIIAQQLLVDLYPASDTIAIEPSLREIWLKNVTEADISRPSYAFSGTSGEAMRAKAHARQKESFKWHEGKGIEIDRTYVYNVQDNPVSCCYSGGWQDGFLPYAIINDKLDLALMVLENDPSLKDKVVDGEIPMLLASRHGNLQMIKMLLAKGATLNGDAWQRTTPLHWLHRFPEQERTEALQLLKRAGNNLNAWDDNSYGKPAWFNCFSNHPSQGTPLHWAVNAQCVMTLRILLDNGADPLYRLNFGNSAFVHACCYVYAPAIELFLDYEAVRASFASWVKLSGGVQVFVQPLFRVVTGGRRWQCLMRNGLTWEDKTRRVIELLVKHGAPTDAVMMMAPNQKMSAAFAAAYHDCNPDVLRSGLEFGFGDHLESTWGEFTSGGTALFLAITHQNRGQFELLLKYGSNLRAVDTAGCDAVLRACEETDDLFYIQKLVEAGASLTETGTRPKAAFMVAVQNGNFKTARWLYDQGFDRDEFHPGKGLESYTTLGHLLRKHTRGCEKRVRFLLSLPDRGSDGFMVLRHHGDPDEEYSAFHRAIHITNEDPEEAETTKLIVFTLLQKYNQPHHLDHCQSSSWASPLSMATLVGNYKVVRALLEAGASVDTADKQGSTPLDTAYERYCHPEENTAFLGADLNDVPKVRRTLDFINSNTAEILSLLAGYGTESISFEWPSWHKTDPGYRGIDWVLEKLRVKEREMIDRSLKAMLL
ncbi:hypothetical protein V496_04334 [Pseudogymnoascus sp. VKM F-4515 (FW-2607)]|nr:hypothetical protein V496_04334 [Pseudogymnoascus sp. VKM F-4515 (FW-2607)]KFY90180.1 hypothetical protein V498_06144 [Pseudogymnoascus sp. VKM F-4517 (FW-2822)]